MTAPALPLTGSDLRAIADAVDDVEATDLAGSKLLGRIELYAPDADEPCGWVQRFDDSSPEMGWGAVFEREPGDG